MLSIRNRFHRRGSINYVYRKGHTVRGEYLSLRHVQSRREDYRLAVVVSKKVSKSAVVRNRIRRRVYEAVRLQKKGSGDPWPKDLIISVFDERVASMPYEDLAAAVRHLLKKAGL